MKIARWIVLGTLVAMVLSGAAPKLQKSSSSKRPAATNPAAKPTASPRPDFSGTWKLDLSKSEMGKFPGQPLARTDVIEQRDPAFRQVLHLVLGSGPDTTVYQYLADSTKCVNQVGNQSIEAYVWWEGKTLRLESKTKMMVFDMTLSERWTLSPDGKQFIISRHVKYPLGDGDQKLVFDRVSGSAPKAAPTVKDGE